ncbi:MAG TPA: MATE family efflux transporter [Gemmatimonadaceae bacterium]|nr:MATE family efflux transporter [Gemmatimonadaceae bacterium]
MSARRQAEPALEATRPPGEMPAAALPLDAHEGVPAIGVTGEFVAQAALVHSPLASTIVRVAVPSVASALLMTLFTSVDAFWVGTRLGPTGLAAVSTSVFWIWMLIALAEMVAVGLTAVASRRHGQRRPQEAARVVGAALLFALGLGVAVALVGLLLVDWLFAVMHTPPDVTLLGRRYLTAYLAGCPLIFGYFAIDAAFRASGDTRTPFLLLTVSVVAALVLDPILILGLGPAPSLGIAGAAIATILTRGSAFVLGLVLLTRRSMIRLTGPSERAVPLIARIGLPTAATGVIFSLIYVLMTRTTTQFGTPALAALGIGHRVESWAYMVGVGFGAAAAAIVGQNLGAGQVTRAERSGWITTGFASVVGVAAGIVEIVFAEEFASLFTDDPAVIAVSASYLRICALSQAFVGAELVLEGALGGAGHTLPPMLTSTTLTAIRIPLAAWAALRWGIDGIWWVICLTATARGIAMMVLWRLGRWKRKSL